MLDGFIGSESMEATPTDFGMLDGAMSSPLMAFTTTLDGMEDGVIATPSIADVMAEGVMALSTAARTPADVINPPSPSVASVTTL
jgi:hypothetical protein